MHKIVFKCKCGGTEIEETLVGATISSTLDAISPQGNYEYKIFSTETDGGTVELFQCESCGEVIKDEKGNDINTPYALFEWLKKRGMLA